MEPSGRAAPAADGAATAAPEGGGWARFESMSMEEKVVFLNELIAVWREPGLVRVRAQRVIPDTTNREYTGLSSMHTHYIADSMQTQGFRERDATGAGHDLPLLVRETTASPLGGESLRKWLAQLAKDPHFPRPQPWMDPPPGREEPMFCSLGNGHFNQSLNLIATQHRRRLLDVPGLRRSHHGVGKDERLRAAVEEGVPSVVLRAGVPLLERKFISLMLNSTYEFKWTVGDDGSVRVNSGAITGEYDAGDSFVGLTKQADSFELDEIIELKVKQEAREHRERAAVKKEALERKHRLRGKL